MDKETILVSLNNILTDLNNCKNLVEDETFDYSKLSSDIQIQIESFFQQVEPVTKNIKLAFEHCIEETEE